MLTILTSQKVVLVFSVGGTSGQVYPTLLSLKVLITFFWGGVGWPILVTGHP